MSQPTTPKKNQNAPGVRFFQHFPKDFLRPYGIASDEEIISNDDATRERLRNFSCEWLVRPGFAISEFCETLQCNWERIKDKLMLLSDAQAMEIFDQHIKKIVKTCEPFFRDGNASVPKDAQEAFSVLENLQKQLIKEETAESNVLRCYGQEMANIGASIFLTGIHIRVATCILSNIKDTASKCTATGNLEKFLAEPSIKTYSSAAYNDALQKHGGQKVMQTGQSLREALIELTGRSSSASSASTPSCSYNVKPAESSQDLFSDPQLPALTNKKRKKKISKSSNKTKVAKHDY